MGTSVPFGPDPGRPKVLRIGEIDLATRKGSFIRNQRRPEIVLEGLLDLAKNWESQFPNITRRSLSATYNCAGHVFATRRTWIEPEDFSYERVLQEDGYRRLPSEICPVIGDVVVYREKEGGEPHHVGVVARVVLIEKAGQNGIWILSKWGDQPEYLHRLEDVPDIYGRHYEFWTERRVHED